MKFLRKSDVLPNWYVIDNFNHGRPEGTAVEWEQILAFAAKGPPAYRCIPGKRVGAVLEDNGVLRIWSPRNAMTPDDFISIPANDVSSWIEAAKEVLASQSTEEEKQ